jgi:flagellar basal-body rod modification protein FlgD
MSTIAATTPSNPASGAAAASSSGSNALASLGSNFNTFLTLLTTQLQNQDPSSPMDSNQFTTELVQFAGVEQQINTNNSLGQLIQLAQGGALMQAAGMVGKQVEVSSDELTLQNATAAIGFTAPSIGPVTITVSSGSGQKLYETTVAADQGANRWTWNGQTTGGATAPDGAYKVAVTASGPNGGTTPLATTALGTVTGVQQKDNSVVLQLGGLSVGIGALTSLGN